MNDGSETDPEISQNPDPHNDPGDDEESENPTTGSIVFEDNFVLDESRSHTNLVLSEDAYDQFIAGEGDLKMISEKVYQYMNDDFDFMIILSIEETQPSGLFFGRSTSTRNNVDGLGGNLFDATANYGSEGRLNAIIYMPRVEYVRNGPFLHEIAHTWGNKGFIPSTVGGHWGYANTAGQLGGFDELIDLGNNTYKGRLNDRDGFGTFANGGNSLPYGNLELYLMGLIGADELETVQVAVNPASGASAGEFTADRIDSYTSEALISQHGARVPSVDNSQKDFSALVVIISKTPISEEKTAQINSNLENFARQDAPDASWGNLHNFWMATQGKATFSFQVLQESIR